MWKEALTMNNWFEVSRDGLRQLQSGKPKTFIINELVQNAFDEDIKGCEIIMSFSDGITKLEVIDDNPEGFKDITHAYTLYADTYKRRDATKRGRYNLGEKQVIAICDYAKVSTTKGIVIFDKKGRHEEPPIRKKGSRIELHFKTSKEEYLELLKHSKTLLVPEHIKFIVNGEVINSKPIHTSFDASLLTEVLDDDVMRQRWRTTQVNLVSHNDEESYIYEMGIPITPTDCPWHIDIQQKIILSIDRDSISARYLKDLYSKVLNNVHDDIIEPSALWVRTAMKAKTTVKEAIQSIMTKRFGEKFCIANPHDTHAMEKAVSQGYNVIYGSELSKEEWSQIKDNTSIQSSSQLFGESGWVLAKLVQPTRQMLIVQKVAQTLAKRILNIDITVKFVDAKTATTVADYSREGKILRFNVGRLPKTFFDNPVSVPVLDLIYHELGHEKESMVEYHKLLTRLGAEGTILALKEPQFFKVN